MKFGTDGVRGLAGQPPIDAQGARRMGQAAARWAQEAGPGAAVFVARDTRPSSEALAVAVLEGVAAQGAVAVDAGVLPSPGLAVVVADAGPTACGVMITASHNAAPDNGFKVLGPGGAKPDDARTATLERWLGEGGATGPADPPVDGQAGALATYVEAFVAALGDVRALAGRRIAVDLAHGAATAVAAALEDRLRDVSFVWVGAGDGVINDGVGSQHPAALQAAVVAQGCDAGIAVDGDADRCVLVDERGAVVPGDTLAWLLAKGMEVQALAVTIMSTVALEASLPSVRVVRTPVGDRHLAAAMASGEVALGAEESGHVLFRDGLPGGDGWWTGLQALRMAWAGHDQVSAACAAFAPWPRKLTGVVVSRRPPWREEPAIVAAVEAAGHALGPGRTLLRYSGTEPLLRVLVEGPDAEVVDGVSARLTAVCAGVLG